jgi:hypothetical protein
MAPSKPGDVAGVAQDQGIHAAPCGENVTGAFRQAGSEEYGRDRSGRPDRRADTRIDMSYRGTDWGRERLGAHQFTYRRPSQTWHSVKFLPCLISQLKSQCPGGRKYLGKLQ